MERPSMPAKFLTQVSQPHTHLEMNDIKPYLSRVDMCLLAQPPCPVFYGHTSAATLDQNKERGHIVPGMVHGSSLGSYGDAMLQSMF